MLIQQLLAPFAAGGAAAKRRAAVAKARDELIASVADRSAGSAAARRRGADAAVVALAAAAEGERLDLKALGPEAFEVVYASGGFPLWRTTAELAERVFGKKESAGGRGADGSSSSGGGGVVASQQFDPRTRGLVNRVVYGPFAVSAFGEYAPAAAGEPEGQGRAASAAAGALRLPAAVTADVQGGRLELGGGKSIDLPFIRGQGRFEVLYADREVRVFRSPGPGNAAAISVQMPLLLMQGEEEEEEGGRGARRSRR